MKVLVTGASGWLGRHLTPMLQEQGHDTVGFDVAPSPWTNYVGDIASRTVLAEVFANHNFDAVIHAAALHKPDIVRYSQQTFIDVNITGTLNLLELSVDYGVERFVFTSTTSLMISQAIRSETGDEAVWLDEIVGPQAPRNIYGVTKLAAENLCRQHHITQGLNAIVLRTARFFPEEDDTDRTISGRNMKANELLNRRATVRDICRAHIRALEAAPDIGFGLYIVSAPTPFSRSDTLALKQNASAVVERLYPDVGSLYAQQGWCLPQSIGRIYDGRQIMRALDFTYETDFGQLLAVLRASGELPFKHDSSYASPALGHLNIGAGGTHMN